jgi:hypothetical protein
MNQRLDNLLAELAKVFGRTTKWRALCKQHNATTEADQIKLAEQVLGEPCTGTVTEGHAHALELDGVKSIDLDDFLGRPASMSRSSSRKQP